MNNIGYGENSFLQEKSYTDYFCLQVELDNLSTLLSDLQDSMYDEIKGVRYALGKRGVIADNLEQRIYTLNLFSCKLYEMARECEAIDNKPQGE